MLRKHFKTLCLVASLHPMVGCSTGARVGERNSVVENCIPDPRNNTFECTDKDGKRKTRGMMDLDDKLELQMGKYWCFPAKPMAEYLKGCK